MKRVFIDTPFPTTEEVVRDLGVSPERFERIRLIVEEGRRKDAARATKQRVSRSAKLGTVKRAKAS
jgi:hypothetical protein